MAAGEYFKGIKRIPFKGKGKKEPLAFQWYDEKAKIQGKSMKDYFRFAVAYWHSFGGTGEDPFGRATRHLPWNSSTDPVSRGKAKMDAAFEFATKFGTAYYMTTMSRP